MLYAYHVVIQCNRKEPPPGFDVEKASKRVRDKFNVLAERIVLKSWLKNPKHRKSTADRIKREVEFDARFVQTKEFVGLWNTWRLMYYGLDPISPKNNGQLTAIENAIAFAKEKGFDLNMLIACVHRGYKKRKYRPGFTVIVTEGEEYYGRFYDDVLADIDNRDYEAMASE